jgi:hypothetical protein
MAKLSVMAPTSKVILSLMPTTQNSTTTPPMATQTHIQAKKVTLTHTSQTTTTNSQTATYQILMADNSWFGVFLGNGADARPRTLELQSIFKKAYIASGANVEMAMFSSAQSKEYDHEVTIYFSPAASTFAKTIDAAYPCERPARKEIVLLFGDHRCWNFLY